jgi:hypothetical protein
MLSVQRERRTREGGTARREQERTGEKRNGPLAAECQRKTRKPAPDNTERICLPLPGSPCQCRRAWQENTKGGKSTVIVPLDRLCE